MPTMSAKYVGGIRRSANLVQDRLDNAIKLNTAQSQQQFEDVEKWFVDKYPHYNWRDWIEKTEKQR